jgi:hypothetical protein
MEYLSVATLPHSRRRDPVERRSLAVRMTAS